MLSGQVPERELVDKDYASQTHPSTPRLLPRLVWLQETDCSSFQRRLYPSASMPSGDDLNGLMQDAADVGELTQSHANKTRNAMQEADPKRKHPITA